MLNQLTRAGYQAYLVGGGVRDLLLRHVPKDFDVATNATPNQIKRVFRNARIIGRRFKIAHILFQREVIEVTTFRGQEKPTDPNQHKANEHGMLVRDNVYGTLEEDAWRRDFSINALYYDMVNSSIIDYTQGFRDIKQCQVNIIGHAATRYQEDPVRMLRAMRFCAKLNFNMTENTAQPIAQLSQLLQHVSNSRLFEEVVKLYQCGAGERVQPLLIQHHLFEHLFPQTHACLSTTHPAHQLIELALKSTDARIKANKPITPAFLFAVLLWFPLRVRAHELEQQHIEPLQALEQAMTDVIVVQNKTTMIPKRHSMMIREIWLLQFHFNKRTGTRAYQWLEHPRFRAAYDLLALRALAGDAPMDLTEWWTTFQEVDANTRQTMIDKLPPLRGKSKAKTRPKPA